MTDWRRPCLVEDSLPSAYLHTMKVTQLGFHLEWLCSTLMVWYVEKLLKALLHTMHCFTGTFYFSLRFLFFLAFFIFPCIFPRVFDPTCWYQRRKEFFFLYYTMRRVKTQASCVFLVFLLTNLTITQPQHIVLCGLKYTY